MGSVPIADRENSPALEYTNAWFRREDTLGMMDDVIMKNRRRENAQRVCAVPFRKKLANLPQTPEDLPKKLRNRSNDLLRLIYWEW